MIFVFQKILQDLLQFNKTVGTDQNYFVQNENGSFHVLTTSEGFGRIIVASPAGDSGCFLKFSSADPLNLVDLPQIIGQENVQFSVQNTHPQNLTVIVGSIRIIRGYSAAFVNEAGALMRLAERKMQNGSLKDATNQWLHLSWAFSNNNTTATLTFKTLNLKDTYTLILQSENQFQYTSTATRENLPEEIVVPQGILTITYQSTFIPLTPFSLQELLKPEYLTVYNNLNGTKKDRANDLVNGLRLLAFKEKFIAGTWRFITYFGRDTLLSMRILAPIVKLEVIEACILGMSNHLGIDGQVAHEEDLKDQAYFDQILKMYENNNFNLTPDQLLEQINDYNMVDENYLVVTLLYDYFQLGGQSLFQPDNYNYKFILQNINFLLNETFQKQLIGFHSGSYTGDWRDSNQGNGFGRYSMAVNVGHAPSALNALLHLFQENVWDQDQLLNNSIQLNLSTLEKVINNSSLLNDSYQKYFNNWKKYYIQMSKDEQLAALNRHRQYYGLTYTNTTTFDDGFIAISLSAAEEQIPIISDDVLFLLLDNQLPDNLSQIVLNPFTHPIPDGLKSDAGYLVSSTCQAPTNFVVPIPPLNLPFNSYLEMLDNSQYHGEVVWGWQIQMLQVALLKQLQQWPIKAPGTISSYQKKQMQSILKDLQNTLNNLQEWVTQELWSWEINGTQVTPVPYGSSGSSSTSCAEQLWSVASLGIMLWLESQQASNKLSAGAITGIVVGCFVFVVAVVIVTIIWKKQCDKKRNYKLVAQIEKDEQEALNDEDKK